MLSGRLAPPANAPIAPLSRRLAVPLTSEGDSLGEG